MTALDHCNNKGTPKLVKAARSRLSLRGQKRAFSSDISPAPEPRSSHRIRTTSSGEPEEKKQSTAKQSVSSNSSSISNNRNPFTYSRRGGQSSLGLSSNNENNITPNTGGRYAGVCPISNLGNTCFLNSVLYALRFLPGFTHDLHHLHAHLQTSKNSTESNIQQRIHFLSELHNVFVRLVTEEKNVIENKRIPAFQPLEFLESVRAVNPMFAGNEQQDAHELLHCLLDQLCHLPQDFKGGSCSDTSSIKSEDIQPPDVKKPRRRSERIQALEQDSHKAVDVVGSKFLGRMFLETCCSECEQVTGREENFLEVCVPVKTKADFDDDDEISESQVFMSALCEEECLKGNNKYWCEQCSHLNEARRSVHYSELPHHLLIHVKRFSAQSRNMFMSKCSEAMAAPLLLPCFCRLCLNDQKKRDPSAKSKPFMEHLPYQLMSVVCHLGASLSSGHYLSYVRLASQKFSSCPEQHSVQQNSPDVANNIKLECSWHTCCALKLDHHLPAPVTNGHPGYADIYESHSMWLECDDDKIKMVSSADVVNMMRATLITPYLLFYSRL